MGIPAEKLNAICCYCSTINSCLNVVIATLIVEALRLLELYAIMKADAS